MASEPRTAAAHETLDTVLPERFRFGSFVADLPGRQLHWQGEPVRLGRRAFDVLALLVRRHGQVVSQTELLRTAWPGRVVQKSNLQVQINALRRAVGAESIATAYGTGYRFAAAVERLTEPAAERRTNHHLRSTPRAADVPSPLAAFVGRENDLRACSEMLRGTRLLTLTGIGGTGKTRLALQFAARLADAAYPGGICVVDLASLADATQLGSLAGAAFERRQGDGLGPTGVASIVACVAGRPALLVLDSCEHLLPSCREFVDALLRECATLRVLATSRERLGLIGEQLYPVAPMTLPAGPGWQAALASEAVGLFAAAARRVDPAFELGPGNLDAVVAICRRLDGLPLAIELAAAQVQLLSADQIDLHLQRDMRLLAGGAGHPSTGERTMLAALAWGLHDVAETERTLFRRLSLFRGGWTLAAASCVAELDEDATLAALRRLQDKSLIRSQADDGGSGRRFTMLEPVRQFALRQLHEAGEAAAMGLRHLEFFLSRAEHGRDGPRQAWMAGVRSERFNILAAQEHSLERADVRSALRLVGALWWFWMDSAQSDVGYRFARTALEFPGADEDVAMHARALTVCALYAHELGQFELAAEMGGRGLALARQTGEAELLCLALHARGVAERELGRADAAVGMFHEAHAMASRHGLEGARGQAADNLAETLRAQRRFAEAADAYAELLDLARQRGAASVIAGTLCNLASARVMLD